MADTPLSKDAIEHLKRGLDEGGCECGNMDLRSWYGEPSREETIRALLALYELPPITEEEKAAIVQRLNSRADESHVTWTTKMTWQDVVDALGPEYEITRKPQG